MMNSQTTSDMLFLFPGGNEPWYLLR